MPITFEDNVYASGDDIHAAAKLFVERGWFAKAIGLTETVFDTGIQHAASLKEGIMAGMPKLASISYARFMQFEERLPVTLQPVMQDGRARMVSKMVYHEDPGGLVLADQKPNIHVYFDGTDYQLSPADVVRRHIEIGHPETTIMSSSLLSLTAEAVTAHIKNPAVFAGAADALKELTEVVAKNDLGLVKYILNRGKDSFPLPPQAHAIVQKTSARALRQ